jgi:hypothetical protein
MVERRPLKSTTGNGAQPPTLEARIASALTADPLPPSAELQLLIAEVETAAATAAQTVSEQRQHALDPLATDSAHTFELIGPAQLAHDRLQVALPRLQQQLSAALTAEYAERWNSRFARIEAERDRAAERFRDYPRLAAELVELMNLAVAIDKQASEINSTAPDGERRRLKSVELTARGLERFSIAQPSLGGGLRLPDWQMSEQTLWPRTERLDPSLFAAPPFDPKYSPEWYRRGEEERAAKAERKRQQLIEADRARRAFYGEVVEPPPH